MLLGINKTGLEVNSQQRYDRKFSLEKHSHYESRVNQVDILTIVFVVTMAQQEVREHDKLTVRLTKFCSKAGMKTYN